MDHALDAVSDRGSVSREEAGVKTPDTTGRGDRARDQKKSGRVGQKARFRKRLPGAVELDGFVDPAAETKPGLLAGFADRRNRQRACPRRRDFWAALEQVGFELAGNRRCDGNAVVRLVDTAAGENILARHEHDVVMALADQDLWLVTGAIDQDQRRSVPGAEIGMVIGFLFLFCSGRSFG